MGLKFPEDLNAWYRWQSRAGLEQLAKNQLKRVLGRQDSGVHNTQGYLHVKGENPQVLVVMDSTSPTSLAALLKPTGYLEGSFALLAPADLSATAELEGTSVEHIHGSALPLFLTDLKVVLSVGHYLSLGEIAYDYAQRIGADYLVVQHGLVTPYAPPLPHNSVLLAFSQADAEFWISGRSDITSEVVGSQLFFEAAQQAQLGSTTEASDGLVFLGQMHGAELPRLSFAQSSYEFCQKNGAVYRPHPSERDKISTLTHKLWAKKGIKIDTSARPLNQSNTPVVSIFSTGVLEAAIRGVSSWVYHSNPPAWLKEFWDRYGMKQWGGEPTAAPAQPELEPALAIAQYIAHRLEK